jgi:hypothetical protein
VELRRRWLKGVRFAGLNTAAGYHGCSGREDRRREHAPRPTWGSGFAGTRTLRASSVGLRSRAAPRCHRAQSLQLASTSSLLVLGTCGSLPKSRSGRSGASAVPKAPGIGQCKLRWCGGFSRRRSPRGSVPKALVFATADPEDRPLPEGQKSRHSVTPDRGASKNDFGTPSSGSTPSTTSTPVPSTL